MEEMRTELGNPESERAAGDTGTPSQVMDHEVVVKKECEGGYIEDDANEFGISKFIDDASQYSADKMDLSVAIKPEPDFSLQPDDEDVMLVDWQIKTEEVDISDYEPPDDDQPDSPVQRLEKFPTSVAESFDGATCSSNFRYNERFRCQLCSKEFATNRNLQRHMSIHTGKKPFACDVCQKRFMLKNCLKRHLLTRTHTGTKPYKCEICPKYFALKSHLQQHKTTHPGTKRFECETCQKQFTAKSSLKSHLLIHSSVKMHKCQVCRKDFTRKSGLQEHTVTHSGEKRFECVTCRKRFATSGNLRVHLLMHTGLREHKCGTCSREFTSKRNLDNHRKVHVTA